MKRCCATVDGRRRWRVATAVMLGAVFMCAVLMCSRSSWAQVPAIPEAALGQAENGSPVSDELGAKAPPLSSENIIPSKNLFEIIRTGGKLMIPIVFCSVLLVVFIFERSIALRRGRVIPGPFVKRVLHQLGEGKLDQKQALALCEENKSTVARVIAAALRKWGRPAVEVEQSVIDEGERAVNELRRYLRVFNGVATVTPLLGLLGTVVGMIHAFNVIATTQAMGRPELLAGGISQALLTTAAGLSVAIPALITYHVLRQPRGSADRRHRRGRPAGCGNHLGRRRLRQVETRAAKVGHQGCLMRHGWPQVFEIPNCFFNEARHAAQDSPRRTAEPQSHADDRHRVSVDHLFHGGDQVYRVGAEDRFAGAGGCRQPGADGGPEKKVINVYPDGQITMDRQVITLVDLVDQLGQARQQYADLGVMIRGDARSEFQHVAEVLNACKQAGISELGISVKLAVVEGS